MEDSTFAGRKHHLAHIGALFVRYDTEIDVLLLSKNSFLKNLKNKVRNHRTPLADGSY